MTFIEHFAPAFRFVQPVWKAKSAEFGPTIWAEIFDTVKLDAVSVTGFAALVLPTLSFSKARDSADSVNAGVSLFPEVPLRATATDGALGSEVSMINVPVTDALAAWVGLKVTTNGPLRPAAKSRLAVTTNWVDDPGASTPRMVTGAVLTLVTTIVCVAAVKQTPKDTW